MYIDPVNQRVFANELKHYGVLGMKWGVRKKEDTKDTTKSATKNSDIDVIRMDKPKGRKKKVTEGNGTGVHKRGEGQYVENAYGEVGVGPYNSYHNAVSTYGNLGAFTLGYAPVGMQLADALRSAIMREVYASEEYKNFKQACEEFEKLAAERKKNWNQNGSAANMVVEEKLSALIRKMNSNLIAIDSKYADKTKLARKAGYKAYAPSKDVLDSYFPYASTGALKVDKTTGRVSKSWKAASPVPNSAAGYKL